MTDANAILMGSGAPAAKFDQVGAVITGTVVREPEASQQTDFRTKTPETWKDGSPKMQVVVRLATTLRDPQRADDDGERNLYIKGKELTNAIRQAVRQSGADGIHTGGTLTVQYVADGPAEVGFNPPKLYAASYTPPAVSFAGVTGPAAQPVQQHLMPAGPGREQQFTQPAYAPPQAPVAQPTVAQSVVPNAPVPCPPNVDPQMWARLTPAQQDAVAAANAAPTSPGY